MHNNVSWTVRATLVVCLAWTSLELLFRSLVDQQDCLCPAVEAKRCSWQMYNANKIKTSSQPQKVSPMCQQEWPAAVTVLATHNDLRGDYRRDVQDRSVVFQPWEELHSLSLIPSPTPGVARSGCRNTAGRRRNKMAWQHEISHRLEARRGETVSRRFSQRRKHSPMVTVNGMVSKPSEIINKFEGCFISSFFLFF